MQPATFIENHCHFYRQKEKGYPNRIAFYFNQYRQKNQSSNMISIIWQAALATDVPGPKIATTPAWYK